METKMKQDLAERFDRLSASWHDDGFSDGLRGVMTELHPDNPYLGLYKAGYEAGLRRKLLNDAAPELLAALKDALKDLESLSQWENASACARKARAAISKATGE